MKRCSKCNNLMPEDAPKCLKCGHENAKKPAPRPVTAAASQLEVTDCDLKIATV